MAFAKSCPTCGDAFSCAHRRIQFCSISCALKARTETDMDVLRCRFNTLVSSPNGNGCCEWQGLMHDTGYGLFASKHLTQSGRSQIRAHRAAWLLFCGPIPDGAFILHKCDNRRCVNIGHLYIGDHRRNMRDRKIRGIAAKGSLHYRSKLSSDQLAAMREERHQGTPIKILADRYGVSISTVSTACRGITYKNDNKVEPLEKSVHGMAKLDDDKAKEIKRLIAYGCRNIDIAKSFGIDAAQISRIRNGKAWTHINLPS